MPDKNFPFDIKFVLGIDMPKYKPYKSSTSTSVDYDCPFCGKKRKFHVELARGVYRCNACQESGGMLSLHQKLNKLADNKAALADLMARYNSLTDTEKGQYTETKYVSAEQEPAKAAFIDLRDSVYSAYIDELSLGEKHYNDLLNRGLSPRMIEKNRYVTVPSVGFNTFAEASLIKSGKVSGSTDEEILSNWMKIGKGRSIIPGIYVKQGRFYFVKRREGILIPYRDFQGRISGFQIRKNNLPDTASEEERKNFAKYTFFVSSEKDTGCGVSGTEQIHFTGFDFKSNACPDVISLTEGPLKADIASYLSGVRDYLTGRENTIKLNPYLALIGVSNTSQLPQTLSLLKERGLKKVRVCVDMDYRDKWQVADAMNKICDSIEQIGLEVVLVSWDPTYKGIDDYLLSVVIRLLEEQNLYHGDIGMDLMRLEESCFR